MPNSSMARPGATPRWFRGHLHMHTFWSDGVAFPEHAVATYRDLGYDFVSLTDHNIFADEPDRWRAVKPEEGKWPFQPSTAMLDEYVRRFGDTADIRTDSTGTQVRLKTYDETRRLLEVPGKFILLPGVEITTRYGGEAGHDVHMNYINLPGLLPSLAGAPIAHLIGPAIHSFDAVQNFVREVAQLAAGHRQPHFMSMNHPFWRYYDIDPRILIDTPAIGFFEIINCGMTQPCLPEMDGYNPDRFWDIVNAFRATRGQKLLLGIGSDDAHFYDETRRRRESGVGHGWIMVRSTSLTPHDLLAAMQAGDFYASSGVTLEDVAFDAADRTLRVSVQPQPGVNYQIEFLTTRRGFDPTRRELHVPTKKPCPERTLPIYSPQIGQVVHRVEGVRGQYRMDDDDLYVRARVLSDAPMEFKAHNYPRMQMAWTQPHC